MNTINREVLEEFREIFSKIHNDPKVRAVVVSSAKLDCFVAGADIKCVFKDSCAFSVLCCSS